MQKIAGGPMPAGVELMQAGAQQGSVGTSKRYHWQQPIDSVQANTDFPIVPIAPDAYDNVANIKQQYAQAMQGNSNWVVPFEQADAAYLMRKRNAEEKAQFDIWIQQKFNLTDPAQNMMLQGIAPELYQRREEVIDSQQELASRYAKVRLRGPKSIDDLYLEWLIETNRIDLPQGPVWDPKKWRQAQVPTGTSDVAWNNKRYEAGFFSPLYWMSSEQQGQQQNTDNYFDIVGNKKPFSSPEATFYQNGGNKWQPRYPDPYSGGWLSTIAGGSSPSAVGQPPADQQA